MEDMVSFVSPNGSFDQSSLVKGVLKESALNSIKIQDPTALLDADTKRNSADEQLIKELRAANEIQVK